MDSTDETRVDRPVTRRRVLATMGTGAAVTMGATAGCVDSVTGDEQTTTTADGNVQFGFSSASTGTYLDIGAEERLGFELAVRHLNQGGGIVDEGVFDGLSGDGVLGRTVDTVTLDSGGSADQTRSNLTPYLTDNDLAMFCGGAAGEVAMEHRDIADEYEVTFMSGMSMLSSLTGADCSPYVYREQAPSDAVIRALGPVIKTEFEGGPTYRQLYVEAPEGQDFVDAVDAYFESENGPPWEDMGRLSVRKGTQDFSDHIAEFNDAELDVLFVHLFGLDAVNFLKQAAADLNDDTTIIVPWIGQSVANDLEDDVDGVIGTVSWDVGIDSPISKTFAQNYLTEAATVSGSPAPVATGPAHDMYFQTLMFAAAAERAGSFDADAVREELEGLTYDTGLGDQTLQACNHQANKRVPVVRGQSSKTSEGSWFEVVTAVENAIAGCDEPPASDCSF